MLFTFLLAVHAFIAAALVGVILLQKSEGGGLGMGGSPSGLMSARGAADLLTRATSVLAAFFVGISIVLAILAATRHSSTIDTSLAKGASAPAGIPASGAAPGALPGQQGPSAAEVAAAAERGNAAAGQKGDGPGADNGSVPLQQ